MNSNTHDEYGFPLVYHRHYRVGINHFTPPVADEVKWFIAQRSARRKPASSGEAAAGLRKRDHKQSAPLQRGGYAFCICRRHF